MRRLTVDYSRIGHPHRGLVIEVSVLREDRDGLHVGEVVVLTDDAVEDRRAAVIEVLEGGRRVRLEYLPTLDELIAEIEADPARAARIERLREEMRTETLAQLRQRSAVALAKLRLVQLLRRHRC